MTIVKIKQKIILILILLFAIFLIPNSVKAEDKLNDVTIYAFGLTNCPHCHEFQEYIKEFVKEYDNVTYEFIVIDDLTISVQERTDRMNLYNKLRSFFRLSSSSTPLIIIGGKAYVGYGGETKATIEMNIRKYVEKYSNEDYIDIVAKAKAGEKLLQEYIDTTEDTMVDLPILGKVDLRDCSLFILTIILGFLDGINPCAMWVLLFLISLLIPTKNKKRIWILGGTFLVTSALFYYVILLTSTSLFKLASAQRIFFIIIGVFALLFGGYNIYKYIKSVVKKDTGCDVTSTGQKKKLMKKINDSINKKSLWIASFGIMGIAIIVNIIELACSAGIPTIYAAAIAINDVPSSGVAFLTFIYVLFFLIDDLIIFFIAAFTLNIKAVSNKIAKYSHLIGGILMLLFGILMIFFPGILTFSIFS